jgi:hypothetical protein
MKYYLTISAIMKNEGPYLKEWLEFHLMTGVEHFYLFDNNSDDETIEILKGYIQRGIVSYQFWPDHPGQLKAYMHTLMNYKNDSFWIAFIDLDEFIIPVKKDSIPEIMTEFEDYAALGVNWFMYGNSGHEKKPEGLQLENYIYHSKETIKSNFHIKSIVNPRKIKSPGDPHIFRCLPGENTVTENKEIMNSALTKFNSTRKIRINHYFTRSTEESKIKMARGRAPSRQKRPWNDFERLNKNDVRDEAASRFIPELKKRIFG